MGYGESVASGLGLLGLRKEILNECVKVTHPPFSLMTRLAWMKLSCFGFPTMHPEPRGGVESWLEAATIWQAKSWNSTLRGASSTPLLMLVSMPSVATLMEAAKSSQKALAARHGAPTTVIWSTLFALGRSKRETLVGSRELFPEMK